MCLGRSDGCAGVDCENGVGSPSRLHFAAANLPYSSSARDCGIVLMILSAMKLFRSLVRVPGILRARKNQRREREGLPQGHALQAVLPDGDADLVV